ncbi:signal transduction histidine kinase [Rathayibacter sp. PhB185]|uniref:sensor histidine kinase n=1 Tax=Rathayibacter sp. PhB186 TaxID=2485199 RepID=UPI000F4C6AA4|nr:histidine kinase [Rathayibacter sp. PhB186]ROP44340.1 signal transduction histidine kinase [Rathayibacter sp. PhB186]ROS46846.1 signal transduction histidine kinase [Rathayibacter sp. PhB185]TCL83099.1 signal transduction histidine kinase [Rathayibacter sp. PhB192]TCM28597.1 signal transduction histidine kinase [Rathayibacter sp. PhB179]
MATFLLDLGARGRASTRRLRWLDLASLIITAGASATALVALVVNGFVDGRGIEEGIGGYVGLGVSLVGVAIVRDLLPIGIADDRARLWLGTVVLVLGPVSSAMLGTDPLVPWNLAVFTSFAIALRGLSGPVVGAFIGVVSYASVVLFEGLGWVNPTAGVALAMSFAFASAGTALRSYAQFQQEVENRAVEAIAARDADAHRRVAEERLSIARDLHDVVGHEIAVLGIHLGVAEVNLPDEAGTSRASLEKARANVQSVLHETQRVLRVLRSDSGSSTDSAPTPDFARIPALIESYRAAGVVVEAQLIDPPADLDPEVSTAAYRIVQEALTNAQKHGAGPAAVSVRAEKRLLTLSISNRRRPDRAPGRRGFGLIGMRERAHSAGGTLRIEETDDDYRVVAQLRIEGSRI